MEDFVLLEGTDTLKASRERLNNNMLSIRSLSSGTAFPTENLSEGMLCYRSDLKSMYQRQEDGSWSNSIGVSITGSSTSCTGNAASATTAETCTGNAASATNAIVSLDNTNATCYIAFVSGEGEQGLKYYTNLTFNPSTGALNATTVQSAVYNDYAEFFPRGEDTEPGDIIALDMDSIEEQYVKACGECIVAGVHSNEYGHIIGGEEAPKGEDFIEYNMPKYIPVALAGRVHIKVFGKVKKGDYIIASDIPGIGIACNDPQNMRCVVGYAVESHSDEGIKKVLVRVKGA